MLFRLLGSLPVLIVCHSPGSKTMKMDVETDANVELLEYQGLPAPAKYPKEWPLSQRKGLRVVVLIASASVFKQMSSNNPRWSVYPTIEGVGLHRPYQKCIMRPQSSNIPWGSKYMYNTDLDLPMQFLFRFQNRDPNRKKILHPTERTT